MVWFIVIVGLCAMGLCLTILIRPEILRRMINFYTIGKRIYLAGFIRLLAGIIILILASNARIWIYVICVGVFAAASGLSVFFLALRRTKILLSRLQKQPNLIIRLYAIAALVIWVLLFYALLPAAPGLLLR